MNMLWFDVGFKRYTTPKALKYAAFSCGLMQDSKDIQQITDSTAVSIVVV